MDGDRIGDLPCLSDGSCDNGGAGRRGVPMLFGFGSVSMELGTDLEKGESGVLRMYGVVFGGS